MFARLGRGERAALVNFRLHLPGKLDARDPTRCAKAKVLAEERIHKTKPQQALETIREDAG